MNSVIQRYLRFCPRTGALTGFQKPIGLNQLLWPLIGLCAFAWIVFRVATKPSRIAYPCVRAAMPLASSFLGSVVFVGLSLTAWMKAKQLHARSRLLLAGAFAVVGFGASILMVTDPVATHPTKFSTSILEANQPMGTAVGIYPGRVVWAHRPEATNENCNPKAIGHEWYRSENNNQPVIDSMVSSAIQGLTGTTTDAAAWDAIFRYHNSIRGKGQVGYMSGENVFIKTNATSSWSGNFNPADLTPRTGVMYYGVSETSPAIVLSVLRQLVNVVGVAESDIYVGDPMKHIYKHCYDLWHAQFPGAHYLDVDGYTNLGREKVVVSTTARIRYSDRGAVLPVTYDQLYTVFEDAEYMINVPMLKGHKRAGVTMFAKNHFGSNARSSAAHLHNGLVAPNEESNPPRQGYGLYRVQVDLLGHQLLGEKNLFYLMDALWATDYELDIPLKWRMAPFNDDWMSSIFASFDPVGIESVGYDFLRAEFTAQRGAGTYVQMNGTDDYLHQAADTLNWPSGIRYDPEDDGTVLGSLGTHEHWNDAVNRQYSRNLGTGNGIELIPLPVGPGKTLIFSFENAQLIDGPKLQYEVWIKSLDGANRMGSIKVYNAYNAAAFGARVAANSRVTVVQNTVDFPLSSLYSPNAVTDESDTCFVFSWTHTYGGEAFPGTLVPSTGSGVKVFTVTIDIANTSEAPGIRFDASMNGQQYTEDESPQNKWSTLDITGALDIPLPVTIVSLTAAMNPQGPGILVEWKTVSEKNNYGFHVQRRPSNGREFADIPNSFTPGHGTTEVPQQYSFADSTVTAGIWYYRLKQVDLDGTAHFTETIQTSVVTAVEEVAPLAFALSQNYPNPFNPNSDIRYQISEFRHVRLVVYDLVGREVAVLVNEMKQPGTYTVRFHASNLASGVYVYCLTAGDLSRARKLLLLR